MVMTAGNRFDENPSQILLAAHNGHKQIGILTADSISLHQEL
jgi:hypothetical protein